MHLMCSEIDTVYAVSYRSILRIYMTIFDIYVITLGM